MHEITYICLLEKREKGFMMKKGIVKLHWVAKWDAV